MNEFELAAEARADVGKGASRRLRRTGRVPGIVFGGDETPTPITLDHNELIRQLAHEGFYSHVLELKLGKKKEKVVLKDIQWHPAKPKVLHTDFQRITATEALHMRIPIHFIGEEQAPGVRLQRGIVTHHATDLEVECLPADLPEYIEVDVSQLEIGDSIRLMELKLPPGVALLDLLGLQTMDEDEREAANQPVVSVQPPAVEEVEEVEEGAEEAAPEAPGEVPTVGETPEED